MLCRMSKPRPSAIVTGGSRRVGRAIVQTLANDGFSVLYTTRGRVVPSEEERIRALTLDLSDPQQAACELERIVATDFDGQLHVLVHNASAYEPGDLGQVTLEQLRTMNRLHVEVPVLLTQALAPALRAARGHVITLLDIAADRPMPSYLAYCASKAALANVTLSLSRELAPEVTVNGIAPGVVDWPQDMPPDQRNKYMARVPLGRAGTPQDVARLVRFLVTEGSYITGQIIRVDGGRSVN
jgi:pteridine reductase